MVSYMEESQLIVEVWGSQKDAVLKTAAKSTKLGAKGPEKGAKSTKELMAAEKAKVILTPLLKIPYSTCINTKQ